MPYMKTEGVSGNIQITSRSIGEVTVEKIGKSAVFFGGGGDNILCEK